MAKIACGVCECSHNKSGECFANFVSIVGETAQKGEDTCCSSFMDKTTYTELTDNVISGGCCDSLECKVKTCKHNEDCCCALDHIKVNGDDVKSYSQTNCLSFCPKN